MRKFFAGLAALAFGAIAAHAVAFVPFGPAKFQFDALTQATSFHLVSSNGNETATTTNIMTVTSQTVASTPFVNSNLLALLANSFNTNLPTGSQISFDFGGFIVRDKTGKTNLLIPNTVLTITFNEEVRSEKQTEIETLNTNSTSFSGNDSQTTSSDVTINYDDTTVSPADGTNSVFQLRGLLVEKLSTNLKTHFAKVDYEFQGSGGGLVHGVTTVLNGTIKEKAAGAPGPF